MDVWMVVNVGLSLLLIGCQNFRPSVGQPADTLTSSTPPPAPIDTHRYIRENFRTDDIDTNGRASIDDPRSPIDRKERYVDTRRYIDAKSNGDDIDEKERYIDKKKKKRYADTKERHIDTRDSPRTSPSPSRSDTDRYSDRKLNRDDIVRSPIDQKERYIDTRDSPKPSPSPSRPHARRYIDTNERYIDTRDGPKPSHSPSSSDTDRYIDTTRLPIDQKERYIDAKERYIDTRDDGPKPSHSPPSSSDTDRYIDTNPASVDIDKRDRIARDVAAIDWRRAALNALDEANATVRGRCPSSPRQLPVPVALLQPFLNARYAEQVDAVATYVQLVQTFLALGRWGAPDEDVFAPVLTAVLERHLALDGCALFLTYGEAAAPPAATSSFLLYAFRNGTERHLGVRNLSPEVAGDEENVASTVEGGDRLLVSIANAYKKNSSDAGKAARVSLNASGAAEDKAGSWHLPWLDCNRKSWSATYSLPIFDDERWRGVLMINIDLSAFDLDQCASSGHLFGGTHLCHRETMQCIHRQGRGFRRGSYQCSCRAGFFYPNATSLPVGLEGSFLESEMGEAEVPDEDFRCVPCHSGCGACLDPSPCFVDYDLWWRGVPLGLQSFCMTISVVLAISVFQLRKCKVIATGMWTVLEMILVGALLLYSTVVIRYFEPTTVSCLLEPWFREMGFAICYGTIILKMYRILVEFRTRKAHRWVIRDKDLLKYLTGIVLVVIGYMSAWTAINVDHIREGDSIVDRGITENKLNYDICKSKWWDYVTEGGEMAFLIFGIYISYHIRNASSPYNEKRHLCLAIYTEALISLLLYVFRHHVWLTFHPDYIFLVYFARCQLTVSITLLLIFGPKLWYHHRPPNDGSEGEHGRGVEGHDHAAAAPEGIKLQDGITSNGEVDIGEINLADMDPEDIRAELRRVYTQLQVLRNKTMRKDNPHISKRRGGRKATHRRFSLQAFHRHRHHHEQEHETDVSKTPEESTGSADAGASLAVATEPGSETTSCSRKQP